MPEFYTDEEVNFMEELNREIENWEETHNYDVDNYGVSDDEKENEKNNLIKMLSNELYTYYYDLRDYIGDILYDIHKTKREYENVKNNTGYSYPEVKQRKGEMWTQKEKMQLINDILNK